MRAAQEFVEEARKWARALVCAEATGPGDYAGAMDRVARRLKVPRSWIWQLQYRSPKTIEVSRYVALAEAVNDVRRKYNEERNGLEATTALGKALLGLSDRLAGQEGGALGHVRSGRL